MRFVKLFGGFRGRAGLAALQELSRRKLVELEASVERIVVMQSCCAECAIAAAMCWTSAAPRYLQSIAAHLAGLHIMSTHSQVKKHWTCSVF